MSPRKKSDINTGKQAVEEIYKLKTKAVEDLVTADISNTPQYSEEELKKYRSKSGIKVPETAKILFAKFWFPAAVCFFFIWGMGAYVADFLDLMVITAIALGIVTDLLTNNVLRYFAPTEGANDKWMMFYKKRYISFFFNIIYSGLVLFLVYTVYNAVNLGIIKLFRLSMDTVPLGVEPIMFGIFYVLCDSVLILCRNTFRNVISDAKRSAR